MNQRSHWWTGAACIAMLTSTPACVTAQSGFAGTLAQLERDHDGLVTVSEVGRSVNGQALAMIQLAVDGPIEPDERAAMLIVAGMEGDMPASTTLATRLVGELASRHAAGDESVNKLLTDRTLYILPRMNPDGHTISESSPRQNHALNLRPWDDDRDGVKDEDGPDDLNGDGLITMMRVRDPEGEWLSDADDPRLMRKADRKKGETPAYKLYTEGIDNDEDGEYNEDPAGGVDLNANFMHGYIEHGQHAGPHQISEPESRALIEFVLAHPNIGIVLTMGRHNNLVHIDSKDKTDDTGKAPIGLHKDDVAIYKHIAERYKELTGIEEAREEPSAGAFYAWAYAQLGIPSFATTVWQRPTPEMEEPESTDDDAEKQKDDKPSKEKNAKKKDKLKNERAWLTYSDQQRDGGGFVDWQPFNHPTLGEVEIGGFVPTFQHTPTDDDLAELAKRHTDFAVDLAGRFASVAVTKVEVEQLAPSLFEVTVGLTNDGYFPTGLAIADVNRRVKPMVISLDVDRDRVVGGDKFHKVRRIDGSGGHREFRWIIQGQPGETVTFTCKSHKLGDIEKPITLKETVTP